MEIDAGRARAFLADRLAIDAPDVALIGAGAWSRCFAFRRGDEDLVIRFGNHLDDFQKDQLAHAYAAPDLPIPIVYDIGRAFDGYYAVSARVYGVPLEQLGSAEWRAAIPSVAAALEALRLADVSASSGFGGWDGAGAASHASWPAYLLEIGDDTPDQRTHGWRKRLAESAQGAAAFARGCELLAELASAAVPRCLVHCDLINRNVLVSGERISGVFDWGCSLYGDHLYDLAWFEFWGPWLPKLDIPALRAEVERRWRAAGYMPADEETRLAACHLHIGLAHLAYNAHLGDWTAVAGVAERMRALTPGF